jgi:integrase
MALALRFLILTLTRRTEVAGARRSEVDLKAALWTIPAERAKSKRTHVVPLSPEAVEVLEAAMQVPSAGGGFIFPSPADAERHLDPHAMTRAVARLCKRLKVPAGSPHDFRRSGATTLTGEAYGFRRFVVGKVLGHNAQDGAAVTSVYDRNEYLSDKRAALEAWAGHVLRLGQQQEPANDDLDVRRAATG